MQSYAWKICPQQSQLLVENLSKLEMRKHVMVEAAAEHGRRRGRQAAGRLRRVEAGAAVEPLGRWRVVVVEASSSSGDHHPGGAFVRAHHHHRLALPARRGGRGRRVDREVGAVAADGQELVEGGVHGERGVVVGYLGRAVQDLRERVLVQQQLGEGGYLGEPRQRRGRLLVLHDRRSSSRSATSSSTAAADGRHGVEAGAEVVEAAAAGRSLVVVQVLVVGERRHHRRRLAGFLVDPAQHPVVQLHATDKAMSSSSSPSSCRHAHRCQRMR